MTCFCIQFNIYQKNGWECYKKDFSCDLLVSIHVGKLVNGTVDLCLNQYYDPPTLPPLSIYPPGYFVRIIMINL